MKLPLFQTTGVSSQKQLNAAAAIPGSSLGISAQNRLWLLGLVSFFTIFSLITVFTRATPPTPRHQLLAVSSTPLTSRTEAPAPSLEPVLDALVHYALTSNATSKMPGGDLLAVSAAIRRRSPCNVLVFGLTHEALLWRTLNHGGRTVFVDESGYRISVYESRHPDAHLEAYDVAYATRVRDVQANLAESRELRRTDCRPVQNLLFSDCRLAVSDLPNYVYDVAWDIILVDGPSGYSADAPGRMAAVFTAAVLARTGGAAAASGAGSKVVDVFVHDYYRETEKVSSEEYLCKENLKAVSSSGQLAHFTIENRKPVAAASAADAANGTEEVQLGFCLDNPTDAASSMSSSIADSTPTAADTGRGRRR